MAAAGPSPVPPALLAVWRAAYAASEPRVSRLQGDVARVLGRAGVPHALEHAGPEGLLVDVFVPPPPVAAGGAGDRGADADEGAAGGAGKGIALEVNGPPHFTAGADLAQGLTTGIGGGGARPTLPHSFTGVAMGLMGQGDALSDDSWASSSAAERGPDGAAVPALVPTLRTRAKGRWLTAAGYRRVTVDFREWAAHPSTEERLELLAAKGLPVPQHLLSIRLG
jgi:hypothetical protein